MQQHHNYVPRSLVINHQILNLKVDVDLLDLDLSTNGHPYWTNTRRKVMLQFILKMNRTSIHSISDWMDSKNNLHSSIYAHGGVGQKILNDWNAHAPDRVLSIGRFATPRISIENTVTNWAPSFLWTRSLRITNRNEYKCMMVALWDSLSI